MEITKEQEAIILELDPNFFKAKLEVGKWYKNALYTSLINYQGSGAISYGFNSYGAYSNKYIMLSDWWTLATDEEVEEALTKEAVKRGYTTENTNCLVGSKYRTIEGDYHYESFENRLYSAKNGGGGKVLFQDGIWATKIETITKAEAEKLLNKIII